MELRVERDWVEAGVRLFLDTAPRTVALAGGSTPRPLYERLAETPYPWSGVEVFIGDERCVPADHPDSNFRMVNEALLSRVSTHVHPIVGCDRSAYEQELERVFGPGMPQFDLVFLGLGSDGHTASLFPGDRALGVTDRPVAITLRPDHPRMTLTLPALSESRLVVFLVRGEDKRAPLARLLAGEDIPAARVKADRVIVLADPAAAPEDRG